MSYGSHDMEFSLIQNRIQSLTLTPGNESKAHTSVFADNSALHADPENPEVLQRLQQERLIRNLEQLQRERDDTTFSRTCLFCKKHFTGNRSLLLNHLMEQHNFIIGAPDNLVFVNELLDVLEEMLKNLKCFYCERIFKDWFILKEHMRKKQHKRINPNNKTFDKFYIINYLEHGKTWIDVQKEDDGSQDSDEKEMEAMECQDESSMYVCLYCDHHVFDSEKIFHHMKVDHNFDFKDLRKKHKLSFYSQLKIINYIRKKMFDKECIICDLKFAFQNDLIMHMTESGHISMMIDESKWNQVMFYFPTYERDNLLCALEDENSDCEEESMVYPEDPVLPTSTVLSDENLRKILL